MSNTCVRDNDTMTSEATGEQAMHQLDAILSQPAGSHAGEYKVLRFRRHARHLVWPAVIAIVTAGAVPFFAWTFPEDWQDWAFFVGAAAVVIFLVLGPFFTWLARTTTVSTRRVIMRSGVLTRHRSEIQLGQIRELKLKRGPLQRIFGAGDIVLQSGSGDPQVLRNVPRVKLTAQALQALIEWHFSSQQFAQQQQAGFGASGPSFASQ